MATRSQKKKTREEGEALTKADPLFYVKLGSLGGKANFEANGSEHFRKAALASHKARRKNAKAAEALEAVMQRVRGRR